MHNERNSQPLMSLNIWHMNIDMVQQNSQPVVQHTSVGSLTPIVYCVSLFSLNFWMFAIRGWILTKQSNPLGELFPLVRSSNFFQHWSDTPTELHSFVQSKVV